MGTFLSSHVNEGLSPRLRGNPTYTFPNADVVGSIPAPAGEPLVWALATYAGWVYPRACGGTNSSSSAIECLSGLSPRLRGNQELVADDVGHDRSIPAPAGEPSTSP